MILQRWAVIGESDRIPSCVAAAVDSCQQLIDELLDSDVGILRARLTRIASIAAFRLWSSSGRDSSRQSVE
ncbi:MAG: hypothetical protein R3315_01180 [Woeseiaceae bacterium]|nr:hypothetical protein [Woeseiaceae bacterium]